MSDPIDIKALDEYLKAGGSSDISRALRELGREDVPPDLDRRVLDEARAAVASGGGRSRSWLRWSAPVALAASVVLVVTVVIESGVQDDTSFATQSVDKARLEPQPQAEDYRQSPQPQFVPEAPAVTVPQPAPAPPPAAQPLKGLLKAEAERSNTMAREEVRADAKALRDQSSAAAPVAVDSVTVDSPTPELAAEQPSRSFGGSIATISAPKEVSRAPAEADSADDDLTSVSSTGTRARRAGRTAGPRNTISNSALTSESRPAADEEAEQIDPQKWLEEIRALRRAGKVAEADLAWQDFRKAYPKFPVADDDIARKK